MAGFHTHITTAAIAGSAASAAGHAAGVFDLPQAAVCAALTVFGGILPDVDAEHSTAERIVVAIIAAILAWFAFHLLGATTMGTSLAAVGIFILSRSLLLLLFRKLTVHRGAMHSIPTALLISLVTVVLARKLGEGDVLAWCAGTFLFLGYIVHLLLDELASLTPPDGIRASFGTAMKLFQARSMGTYLAIYMTCLALLLYLGRPDLPLHGLRFSGG